jgi:hypothetical protein
MRNMSAKATLWTLIYRESTISVLLFLHEDGKWQPPTEIKDFSVTVFTT